MTFSVCFLRSEKNIRSQKKGTTKLVKIRLKLETKTFNTIKYELSTKSYKNNCYM